MNYLNAVEFIENVKPARSTYDLGRMSSFMALTNNIQDTFASIHVAGTNGKGSTVAIIDSILRATGLKVGRFTGPHILNWNERFHIDGKAISQSEFAELFAEASKLASIFEKKYPQYGNTIRFEYLTAMAFLLFAKQEVDVAVIEVGLGGRLDPTNVITSPLACAITTVDLDHTHILGKTIEEIARDKSGIIKNNIPTVTGANWTSVKEIAEIAKTKNAPLWHCESPDRISKLIWSNSELIKSNDELCNISLYNQCKTKFSLNGSFQNLNSLVAYALLTQCAESKKIPAINKSNLSQGLANVFWPGRVQYIPSHNLILDAAHNAAGAKALRESLNEMFPNKSFVFVFAAYENKNYSQMIEHLLQPADILLVSKIESERMSHEPDEMVDFAKSIQRAAFSCSSLKEALQKAFSIRKNDQIVVSTGSFVTVAETMRFFNWQEVENTLSITATKNVEPVVVS